MVHGRALAVVAVVSACGGGGGGTVPPPGDGGEESGIHVESCNSVVPSGPTVTGQSRTGALPTGHGGTISPGTYAATAADVYGGQQAPGSVQLTIVLGQGTYELAERVSGLLVTNRGTWATSGASLTLHTLCPQGDDDIAGTYDASSSGFAFYAQQDGYGFAFTFTRQQ